ncbi:MAG TPA: GatB/YqeY domain-containing protein [Thermomicrobiaceae bacterium]|nr:GatB/YqeY domain-containing protein [Thermomicrobiaceae bacterium]
MTSLADRLLEDLKEAVRASDAPRRQTLRYLRSEIHNVEIERKHSLSDEEITSIIRRQIKQRRDSIEQFAKGGREDLVEHETAELVILQSYLPEDLSADQLERMAREAAGAAGATSQRDMGKVMAIMRERVAGRADGSAVANAVKQVLATLDTGSETPSRSS